MIDVILQRILVALIDLALQGKQAHWNVIGPRFQPVHGLLDDWVDSYRDWYDTVAERMRVFQATPDGRADTVGDTSFLPPIDAGLITDDAALMAFESRIGLVATEIRTQVNVVDLGTQNILLEILDGLDKQRWMIRSLLA